MKLSEDDLYRTSTQFNHWSFTAKQLAAQRLKTNIQAAERVKANVARQRAQRLQHAESDSLSSGMENTSGANTPLADRSSDAKEVDCLTAQEELTAVDEFCERVLKMGAHCEFPIEVTATSIQFLRRFYLYNSPMTYHGQNISRTGLFLACKTENAHQSVEAFAANFKKTTSDDILAPEYLIVQALRFNFEVKHPFRGLKGGHLELMEMARGRYDGPNCIDEGMTSADLRTRMLQLPFKNSTTKASMQDMEKRITEAYSYASHILKNAAILTDAYFLYTPAQIWLSAHLLADEALTLFYLSLKIPDTSPLYAKVLVQLRACAALLSSHRTFRSRLLPKAEVEARDAKHQEGVKRVIDKLKLCRDPEKVDLVKLNQAQKRGGAEDGEVEENKAKRRKVERETYEKANNDFWGPELGKAAAA